MRSMLSRAIDKGWIVLCIVRELTALVLIGLLSYHYGMGQLLFSSFTFVVFMFIYWLARFAPEL